MGMGNNQPRASAAPAGEGRPAPDSCIPFPILVWEMGTGLREAKPKSTGEPTQGKLFPIY